MFKLLKTIYCGILILTIILAMGCSIKQNPGKISNTSIVLQGPAWASVWQQKSGEYKALCFQAYNLARTRLDALLQKKYTQPLAIVTDIDETVLDNSPYQVHQALNNEEYSDASWMEWTARIDCDTIPGALSFLRYAKSRGVDIFYITNRLEAEREATLKDLERWGFPDATDSHLTMKTTTSGKEPRRAKVAITHEILLLLGDNLSDFSEIYDKKTIDKRNDLVIDNSTTFGNRFIVLPNAMYGDWDGAIYKYQYDLPAKEKERIIVESLKRY
nr:5'-nucleotidase, lipoprotein e(P4) family [Allomuricauda sp.]